MKKYPVLKILLVLIIAFFAIPMIKNLYLQPGTNKGDLAIDFNATLADGAAFSLFDMKGQYVLLDFWGSWCGPCIKEMPALKELYSQYNQASFENAEGFSIISVAIEQDEKRWRKAMDRLQMPWKQQVMDKSKSLRFFNSPIATLYGVKQVPTKFLIDESGKIVDVDPTYKEIISFLDKGLGK